MAELNLSVDPFITYTAKAVIKAMSTSWSFNTDVDTDEFRFSLCCSRNLM
jgi:hypothetical protein